MLKGHQLQRAAAGYTALLVAGVVARRAMLGVKSRTALLRERRPAGRDKQEGGCSALPGIADDREASFAGEAPRNVSLPVSSDKPNLTTLASAGFSL